MTSNLPEQSGGPDDLMVLISTAAAAFTELERERLAIQREQQAVTLRSWEVADNADRRQNETIVKSIEADTEKDKRRYRLLVGTLLLTFGIPSIFLSLLLVAVFFGNPAQSAIALRILSIAGTGVGGAGVIFLVGFAINRLIAR